MLSRTLYRAARFARTSEVLATGNPTRIGRYVLRRELWRLLYRALRG